MASLQFSLPVWGGHLHLATDFCLPSLLAPRNIPAVGGQLIIQTDESGKEALSRHPVLPELAKVVDTKIEVFEGPGESDQRRYARLSELNRRSMERAISDQAVCVPLIPDVVYADGSISFLAGQFHLGKKLALMTSLRAGLEHANALNAFRQTALSVRPRDLVKFGIYHCHPIFQHCTWGNPYFSTMPYMMLFPVEGEGFIGRTWTLQPAGLVPNRGCLRFDGTIDNDLQKYFEPADTATLVDSDDFVCCEIAPQTHFYRAWEPFAPTAQSVGHWAKKSGFSAHNWKNLEHSLAFRCTDTGTKPWFDAKAMSDSVVAEIKKVAGHA